MVTEKFQILEKNDILPSVVVTIKQKKQQLGDTKKKFSLKEFVWLGFNYTVGINFIGACAVLTNRRDVNTDDVNGIGMHIIWIYLLEGLFAGVCAWAFARIARVYKSSNNGGAYIYTRGTFNRFMGLFVTFMIYVGMPFMITFQILMLIRGTFSPSYVWIHGSNIPWYGVQWGPFGDLYLDLIGIVIYLSSAIIIFFGIRMYKKFAHITAAIKWGSALFLVIAAVGLACTNGAGSKNIGEWAQYSSTPSALHVNQIVASFNSCFYFFSGFEIFSTAGQNVKNPQRNIGLGVTLIMVISTIFYVFILLLFFAAIPINEGFQQNESMSLWSKFSSNKVILYGGPILLIISSISLKINAAMQNSLYGGTMIQPMAVEGYFPDSWGKLDKDALPAKASKINLIIVALFVVIWLAIPDLAKGFQTQSQYNEELSIHGREAAEKWLAQVPAAFTVASLTAASSAITILVYIIVLISTFKMQQKKQLTLRVWEKIAFGITLVFMIFLFVYHYGEVATTISDGVKKHNTAKIVGSVIELAFVVIAVAFFVTWYYTYYSRKVKVRIATDPNIQKRMDSEFLPIDDWSFTATTIAGILKKKPYKGRDKVVRLLNEYMERNIHINSNSNNQNYREANRFLLVLTKRVSPLTASLDKIAQRFEVTNAKNRIHKEVMFSEITRDVLHEGIIGR
ncbi:MAG: APC family permease [Mycoplasmataceae bacterium]|nr:APC family permease [Mycoplasmataceae bacterium]